eukprot:s474_g11.t1
MGPANEPALALAEGDATLQFLLNADAGTRISFLSFLFATKSISWALAVLLAARLRHSYVPIIYGAGPVATAIDTARRRFPRVAMGAERAAQRAAASRSARLLAGLAGAEPLHLAPAVVEVTVAFRFVWPLWFPIQCWLMLRCWPGINTQTDAFAQTDARYHSKVEDVIDSRSSDIE